MLKTSSAKSVKPKKGGVKVGDNSRVECDRSEFDRDEIDSGEISDNKVGKKVQKMFKSKNLSKSKKTIGSDFFTLEARLIFTNLRQAFFKTQILYHFDPEYCIRIETDAFGYTIDSILNQLTADDLGQWHPMAFFSYRMILMDIRYKTHDGELLAIIEPFKTWRYYLEGSQHKVLVLTNYNNFCRFINTKSLSFRQVH